MNRWTKFITITTRGYRGNFTAPTFTLCGPPAGTPDSCVVPYSIGWVLLPPPPPHIKLRPASILQTTSGTELDFTPFQLPN